MRYQRRTPVWTETQLSNVDEDETQDVMVVDAAAQASPSLRSHANVYGLNLIGRSLMEDRR